MKKPKLTTNKKAKKEKAEEIIINQNFSLQVVMQVIQQHLAENKSVVCSPVLIDTILSILAIGAENSTLDQLLKLLGHVDVGEVNEVARKLSEIVKGSNEKNAPEISSVNGLWLDRRVSLVAKFQNVLRDVHNAQARVVDFVNEADQVIEEANSWAEEKTKGLINQILTRNNIKNDTSLLLANALYFKGTWHKSFKSIHTADGDFSLLNGDKVRVPFMNQWRQYFEYGTSRECQVLQMPYKTGEETSKCFSMYFLLPFEQNGLPNLMEKIKVDPKSYINKIKLKFPKIAKLSIPRFKFDSNIDLKEPMKQLGLTLLFEEDSRDFSGIIDIPEPVYVTDIFQKCCVETNEQGTEAAVMTHARLRTRAARPPANPPPPINFVADHPFMFMIREEISGAILFIGTMLNPE